VRLSRGELRDHINYCKNDRRLSYRFYGALLRLKSPMRYICEIFGARRFRVYTICHYRKSVRYEPFGIYT